ncbi:hypothetical protein C7999DRAFT_43021 [Corynascus novoguineensis]|uniref:LysM domain-containing protein n=1 Tax=Corynascus novoguineensis TaxID=1126955 RepID=A0AAN7HL27_9PEZI|nr:hypothetical protein C7999DRAFT_43021 [Corynascus novoguineensis]
MRNSTTILLFLTALTRRVSSTNISRAAMDPETLFDCVEWYNNIDGDSCEYVRDYFTITPEDFHIWNPSISLECEGWNYWQSYRIVALERLEKTGRLSSTSTETTSTTTTTSAPTLGPSPTSWVPLGCYSSDDGDAEMTFPIPEKRVTPAGPMTVTKCQDGCYRTRHKFVGLQDGRCNTPCAGDAAALWGSKGLLFMDEAGVHYDWIPGVVSTTGTGSSGGIGTSSTGINTAVEMRASSGVAKHKALFWGLG